MFVDSAMPAGLLAFGASFVASGALVAARDGLRGALDHGGAEPQKVHASPVPRVGGIALFVGLVAGGLALDLGDSPALIAPLLLTAALPALIGGLLEDFTGRVSVRVRLLTAFCAAAVGFFVLDGRVTSLDLTGSEWLLGMASVSFAFTLFAVGGFSNALNIVDGFNGLSAIAAWMMLVAMAVVATLVSDIVLAQVCLLVGASILGFLVWNYPRGTIFLGDGGAYLLGFLIAELAVLLVQRNSSVSPWFALLLLFYPVWETVFSSYRRRVLRGRSAASADGLHLHTLVYRRLVRWKVGSRDPRHRSARNALTTPYLVALVSFNVVPATLFWDNTPVLQLFTLGFALLYVVLYWRIVRLKAPQRLILRRPAGRDEPPRDEGRASEGVLRG
jgi:UDP-GlcNAc:undecaprenyl-phosphate/decaprenyl-phosphate GlcNAc-1-phosphate transferase